MTLRMNVENAVRTEVILSFDNEDEARAWLDDFQKASALYAAKQEAEGNPNVPEQAREEPVGATPQVKKSKK